MKKRSHSTFIKVLLFWTILIFFICLDGSISSSGDMEVITRRLLFFFLTLLFSGVILVYSPAKIVWAIMGLFWITTILIFFSM
jgi:hypothetical protein